MITSCFGHSVTYLSPVADTEKTPQRVRVCIYKPRDDHNTIFSWKNFKSQNGKREVFGCVNKKQHKLESIFIFAVS